MKVKLGKLVNVKTGKLDANASSINGAYPFFTCSKEPLKISTYSYDCECVLVAGNGDLNVKYYNGKFDAYQRTYIIEDNGCKKIYIPYLYYFMDKYVEKLRTQSIGGVIKYIKLSNITEVEIVLPNVDIQKKIVDKLDKVNAVINKKNMQLEKLDLLVRSLFIEMFGDPIYNSKNWQVVQIGDIATDVRYGTSNPAVEGGKYPYLRMNNITVDGKLDLRDLKYIDISDYEIERYVVRKGDLLFNRTNSIELVGKTTTFDLNEDMIIAGYIILEVIKSKLRDMAKGAVNQANINAQELQSIRVYLPDIDIQKKFVKTKCKLDKSKFASFSHLSA